MGPAFAPFQSAGLQMSIGGRSGRSAAEHLNISTDAVKSRLHRARQMMREQLLASGYLAVAS